MREWTQETSFHRGRSRSEDEETAETLHDKLASLGAPLLLETVSRMKRGEVTPIRQDPSQVTYAPPLKKEDGRIDWRREAIEIDRQVRAFSPWPGAYTSYHGQFLKIFKGRSGRKNLPEKRERFCGLEPISSRWGQGKAPS